MSPPPPETRWEDGNWNTVLNLAAASLHLVPAVEKVVDWLNKWFLSDANQEKVRIRFQRRHHVSRDLQTRKAPSTVSSVRWAGATPSPSLPGYGSPQGSGGHCGGHATAANLVAAGASRALEGCPRRNRLGPRRRRRTRSRLCHHHGK